MTIATLAAAVGSYVEAVPPVPVRRHVRRTWVYRLPDRHAGPIAVVPDGCIDLRWIAGRLSVDGPHRSAVAETLAPGALVVGLRFQPGAAPRWLGLPASELTDRCIALEDIWGGDARHLAEWAGAARTPSGIARRLETAMSRRATINPTDGEMRRVFALLEGATHAPVPDVATVAVRLGLGERTLRRRCHEAFGYGPKTLGRILRFQRFLRLAYHCQGEVALARCAGEAGYADQAHLSREARRLSGLSPRTIAAQLVR
ncbi:MAG: AraC family transcriptional regulator [Chloroflexota bacterium]|nr:AraC family transcriptional regulator [Chloroflexota bacterium]